MYKISLRNNKIFSCGENENLIEAARRAGIMLDHSCLSGRCSSCKTKVESGSSKPLSPEISLSEEEREEGYILSCIRAPISDMVLDVEDLGEYNLSLPKTVPAKIESLNKMTEDVIRVELRFPKNQGLNFISGQYIDVIRGTHKRSYSIANSQKPSGIIELLIKKYPGGVFSEYWFDEARPNDLLRVEGPKGTFFMRKSSSKENLVFLATGTGIAPIRSILETLSASPGDLDFQNIYLFWGVRFFSDLFWTPDEVNLPVQYFPVVSREHLPEMEKGYIQDVLIKNKLDLARSIVYACGSENMIKSAKDLLIKNGLPDSEFYSDAFVMSN